MEENIKKNIENLEEADLNEVAGGYTAKITLFARLATGQENEQQENSDQTRDANRFL